MSDIFRSLFESLRESDNIQVGEYSIEKISPERFTVRKGDSTYSVDKENSKWHCSCPAFKYSGKGYCKHIDLLKNQGLIKIEERLPMNLIDDIVIPTIDSTMKKYVSNWVDYIVGSYRRHKDTFKDVDIILPLSEDDFKNLYQELSSVEGFEPVMSGGDIFRGYIPVEGKK